MIESISAKDCTVTTVPHSGMLIVSAIIGGYLTERRYMGYSRRAAVALFLEEFSR